MKKIRENRALSAAAWLLFSVYIAVLLKLTVFRTGFGTYPFMSGSINMSLFGNYLMILGNRGYYTFAYLFFGNIVWFMPLGAFLRAFRQKGTALCVLCGFLLSLLIEISQYVFGTGVSELDDLILNTAGAAAGAWIGGLVLKRERDRATP